MSHPEEVSESHAVAAETVESVVRLQLAKALGRSPAVAFT